MKKIITLIKIFLFGKPIQGEPIGEPTFRTVMPPGYEDIDFFTWAQNNNVCSQHRS